MPTNYYAFGLNIESEIEFPLFIEGDRPAPDLVIRLGPVQHILEQAQAKERILAFALPSLAPSGEPEEDQQTGADNETLFCIKLFPNDTSSAFCQKMENFIG